MAPPSQDVEPPANPGRFKMTAASERSIEELQDPARDGDVEATKRLKDAEGLKRFLNRTGTVEWIEELLELEGRLRRELQARVVADDKLTVTGRREGQMKREKLDREFLAEATFDLEANAIATRDLKFVFINVNGRVAVPRTTRRAGEAELLKRVEAYLLDKRDAETPPPTQPGVLTDASSKFKCNQRLVKQAIRNIGGWPKGRPGESRPK